jgi:tetratricopeptide (TPR) repeat protein
MSRTAAVTLAAVLAVGLSGTARADSLDPPERARTLSDQGRTYHADGDYDHAIGSFKAAYELAPSPGLLFNLAQAYRLKGDCENAAIMYKSYLRTGPDRQHRELAESQLDTVERCVSRRVQLHPLIGTADATASSDLARRGDRLTTVDDQPGRPGVALKRAGIATTIGGGVLLGVGVYYAVQASDYSSKVQEMYANGAKWKDIQEVDAKGRHASTMATVFALGGGAAAITGGVLYLMGRREAKRAEHRSFSFTPTPTGGEVQFAWAF